MGLLPGAEPFRADGGPVGVVLSHGFTGTPASMRPWAEHLAAQGCTVRAPLLPGHGTRWQDANRTTWQDWYGEVEQAYDELRARCDTVFAGGLSMGGTLVTRLAEVHQDVAGLVLVNPAFAVDRFDARFAKFLWPLIPSRPAVGGDIKKPGDTEPAYDRTPVRAFASLQRLWAVTQADLGRVRAPIQLFRSRVDHVVSARSGRILLEGAIHTSVQETLLEDSYHVATLDNDAQLIFDGSWTFLRDIVASSDPVAGS